MTIEVSLWVLILFAIAFFLLLIHVIFGDLLGKALYNYLKHKEEKEKDKDKLKIIKKFEKKCEDKKDGME